MTPSGVRVASALALGCLAAALLATFLPASSGGISCGTWIADLAGGEVVYEGSYAPLRGLDMSEAYAEVPGSSCGEQLADRRAWALGLLGAAVALAAFCVARVLLRRRRSDA